MIARVVSSAVIKCKYKVYSDVMDDLCIINFIFIRRMTVAVSCLNESSKLARCIAMGKKPPALGK